MTNSLPARREQSERLKEARSELTQSLTMTTLQLKAEFDSLNQATVQSLDSIRDRVDEKLMAITDQVQRKLDENIKEGFAQFEKVQQHLKAAEEQLREVGASRTLHQRPEQHAEATAPARAVRRSEP